eukprot:gene14433-15977_t
MTEYYLACDPFAKRKTSDPKSLSYDESPDEYDQRQKRKAAKLRKKFEVVETLSSPIDDIPFSPNTPNTGKNDIHFNERILHEQAKRELQIQNSAYLSASHGISAETNKPNDPKLNLTIQPGESMKKFLRRVELEKKRVLLEEIPKQSATAIKRKEKFKALKLKRKLKKSGNLDSLDEEVVEFGSREDGYIRPSDHQDSRSEFVHKEYIPFGETAHAPPNLKQFITQLDKQKAKKQRLEQMTHSNAVNEDQEEDNQQLDEGEGNEDIEEEETKKSKKKKRKMDWDKFDADEFNNNGSGDNFIQNSLLSSRGTDRLPSNPLQFLNQQKKLKQQTSSLFSQAELEKQRKEIQEKYRQIKEKRKQSYAEK